MSFPWSAKSVCTLSPRYVNCYGDKTSFLAHVVSAAIDTEPAKVTVVRKCSVPKNTTELHRFLELAARYRSPSKTSPQSLVHWTSWRTSNLSFGMTPAKKPSLSLERHWLGLQFLHILTQSVHSSLAPMSAMWKWVQCYPRDVTIELRYHVQQTRFQ